MLTAPSFASTKSLTMCRHIYSGKCFACTLAKRDRESKRLRVTASLRVETRDYYHHGRKKKIVRPARLVPGMMARPVRLVLGMMARPGG